MRFTLVLFAILMAYFSDAQVVQINPNIQWKYVRTQKLEFKSGRIYQFEFPADKGYDYIFNFTHDQENIISAMHVMDVQYEPLKSKTDSNNTKTMDLHFRVSEGGTYIIVAGLNGKNSDEDIPVVLNLIRREAID